MRDALSSDEMYSLARGQRILDDKWREPTKWEVYLAQQIERLTAELEQVQAELLGAQGLLQVERAETRLIIMDMAAASDNYRNRAESAETKNASLVAQVAAMMKAAKYVKEDLEIRAINGEVAIGQDAYAQLCDSITKLPAEAEKLMRLVEAVDVWMVSSNRELANTKLFKSYRDLQGGE